MPEWLLKNDNYIPQNRQDSYIDKSILSILGLLAKFNMQAEKKRDVKFNINANVKMLFTLLLIVLVSISKSSAFVIMVDVLILFVVSLMSAEDIKHIIKLIVAVSIFTFIILLPSILMGNKSNSYLMLLKVLASTVSINIISATTKWNDIIAALKKFFIPDMFIFVLDITMKYILILGEFSLNMLYALKLRSIGKNRAHGSSLSGIVGTLFLKSKEMSEEMYEAMECRCFNGEYKANVKFKIGVFEIIGFTAMVILLAAYIYFDRL